MASRSFSLRAASSPIQSRALRVIGLVASRVSKAYPDATLVRMGATRSSVQRTRQGTCRAVDPPPSCRLLRANVSRRTLLRHGNCGAHCQFGLTAILATVWKMTVGMMSFNGRSPDGLLLFPGSSGPRCPSLPQTIPGPFFRRRCGSEISRDSMRVFALRGGILADAEAIG